MLRSPISRALTLGGALLALAVFAGPASAYTGTGADARNPPQAGTAVAPLAPPGGGSVGAAGVDDPYFPLLGNGGFDVRHYDMTLAYDPATDRLDATAVIEARALQDLSRFDLDLQQLDVSAVRVNDVRGPVQPRRPGAPDHAKQPRSRNGSTFEVAVAYGGIPQTDRRLADRVRLPVRLPAHRRRRLRGLRAERAVDVDAALRPSQRQGGVDLPGHGPGGQVRGLERAPASRR